MRGVSFDFREIRQGDGEVINTTLHAHIYGCADRSQALVAVVITEHFPNFDSGYDLIP